MADSPIIAALEIGTSRTVVCVGEAERKGGRVRIIGSGVYPSAGVSKGQITDLEKARESVRGALEKASNTIPNVDIRQALLTISGGHIQSQANSSVLAIQAPDKVVTHKDIETVDENAGNIPVPADREVLHRLMRRYTVDEQPGIEDPLKMTASLLTSNVLAIHGLKNRIHTAVSVAKGEGLEVSDVVFSGVCAAMSVLSKEQKQRGVLLVDLGGGTTSYMAYTGGAIATAGCIAVGGWHVTRDIELAFSRLNPIRAEKLKCEHGCATFDAANESPRITVPKSITELDDLQINRRSLNTVINARVNELFSVLRARLDNTGLLPNFGAGVVLTGGGAYLRKITDQAQHVLGMPCTIGTPQNVDGLEQEKHPAMFATIAGLVMYGHESYEDKGFFSQLLKFFKRTDRKKHE